MPQFDVITRGELENLFEEPNMEKFYLRDHVEVFPKISEVYKIYKKKKKLYRPVWGLTHPCPLLGWLLLMPKKIK